MNQIKSPNFSGREGHKIQAICIHIAEGDKNSVISEFTNPDNKKSSHYLVCKDGEIIQFVEESQAAWTQGYIKSPIAKIVLDNININPNLYCVSIEHEGLSKDDINDIMYDTTTKLVREICLRYGLVIDRDVIIGHREIRNDKLCPGKINVDKIVNMAAYPKIIYSYSNIEEQKKNLLQQIINLYLIIINFLKGKK